MFNLFMLIKLYYEYKIVLRFLKWITSFTTHDHLAIRCIFQYTDKSPKNMAHISTLKNSLHLPCKQKNMVKNQSKDVKKLNSCQKTFTGQCFLSLSKLISNFGTQKTKQYAKPYNCLQNRSNLPFLSDKLDLNIEYYNIGNLFFKNIRAF
jgi:hypothetical protein